MRGSAIPKVLYILVLLISIRGNQYAPQAADCNPLGWFPTNFGLKDHSIFWFDGYYYIISIYMPGENFFAYGRSKDFCVWEDLTPVLSARTPGTWDELAIWAPFVYEEDGVFYLFYTGVTSNFTQSIMLATTRNPSDPASWAVKGMIFQPNHENMIWKGYRWADNRDPMVNKVGSLYFLYYTGLDTKGGIIGMATSTSPLGPWLDWGSIITLPLQPFAMAESSTVVIHDGYFYLFYNDTSQGEFYRIGSTPSGPWTEAYSFGPGWADEIWAGRDGLTYVSYLTNYSVTISRLSWDNFYSPARPSVGDNRYHLLLPLVVN